MKFRLGFLCVVLLTQAVPSWAGSYANALIQEAHKKHLADQRYWRLLLHDRRNLVGIYESDIDDPKFFLDPHGRRDPTAELDATVKAFFDPPSTDSDTQHPQCRFPARYAWLKDQLGFDARLPEQPCPRFTQWRDSMNAEGVTMIFASYYMNNPASMYGHTFMRLNGKGHGPSERLLDYTINYAADTATHNGILFAVLGLAGGYRGRFSTLPYYVKVQQYNNLESRDLWEYSLALGPSAIDRMVRHLWEMGNSSDAYFFINRNCSYQLLPILEVADPTLHLIDRFWLKAIPTDTLRVIRKQPGLVTGVVLRPSHLNKMLAARSQLSPVEVSAAEKLASDNEPQGTSDLAPYSPEQKARILDSAYDLFRYRTGFARDQPAAVQEQNRRLLSWRNEVGLTTRTSPLSAPVAGSTTMGVMKSSPMTAGNGDDSEIAALSPDRGHETGRIGLSYGFTNHSHFEEVSMRPAIHDQDDPPLGYVPGSQLQMFHLRLRYDDDRKTAYLQQFTLVDLKSYSPWDSWVHHPSWEINTGFNVANDVPKDPENSLYYGFNGGSGLAFHTPLSPNSMVYALAKVDTGVGDVFRDHYRLGGGGSSGLMFTMTRFWQVHVDATYYDYIGNPFSSTRLQLVQSCPIARNMELRATLQRQNTYKEILLSLLVYL